MKLKQPKQRAVELVFRALSDLTRIRILHLLRGGELCVCDLVSVLDLPQPTVSRHLAYLRKTGLVLSRKDGHWIHYRLAPAESAFQTALLVCLAHCAEENAQLGRDTKRLQACGGASCCE